MDYNGRGYSWYHPVLESTVLSIICKHVCCLWLSVLFCFVFFVTAKSQQTLTAF